MPATRASLLGAAIIPLMAGFGAAAPAGAEIISAGYVGHRAYRGIDDGFFTGVLLTGQDLFRVDLSQVVSRYIGETEKNLGAVFERLGIADVVLLFDEADALFGKRGDIKDAHDRYADDFIVLDIVAGTWFGQVALGPEDGVREDGVYELAGRYTDLVITPIPEPAGLAALATVLCVLAATRARRRGVTRYRGA